MEENPYFFLVLLVFIGGIVLFPLGRILLRMGVSVWWLLLFLVPFGPLAGIWALAFAKWPSMENRVQSTDKPQH